MHYFAPIKVNYSVLVSNIQKLLIVIGGPTASGKTDLAVRTALRYHTHIVSADSRQVYKEMNIGTAKPTEEQLNLVPHYFINHLHITQEFTAGDFEKQGLQVLQHLFQQQDVVVLTGGSGLFIQALCVGFDSMPEVPTELKKEVELIYKTEGITALQGLLKKMDPAYYAQVDLQNPSRLIRAISVIKACDRPYSDLRLQKPAPRPFESRYYAIDRPRQELYERINQRVDNMIQNGLVEEVKNLIPFKHLNALQTVGYQELFDYFDGKLTFEKAVELIKQNTRRYAKRQLTWMRKYGEWNTVQNHNITI